MVKYQQGLKRSLKGHFGDGFDRLENLLEALPATLPHTKLSEWSREKKVEGIGSFLEKTSREIGGPHGAA